MRTWSRGPAAPRTATRRRSSGTLEERLFLGSGYRHYVRVGTDTVMVDDRAPLEPGPVTLRIPAAKLQVYPASGAAAEPA